MHTQPRESSGTASAFAIAGVTAALVVAVAVPLAWWLRPAEPAKVAAPAALPAPSPVWNGDSSVDLWLALSAAGIKGCDGYRHRPADGDTTASMVWCPWDGRVYLVAQSGAVSVVRARTQQASTAASPSDLRQAREFLASLPAACTGRTWTEANGTVVVSYSCSGNGRSASGSLRIEDGIVTGVQ